MKKLTTILLILTVFTALSCKDTVMEMNNPERSGTVLDLKEVTKSIDFTQITSSEYTDFQSVKYPINEWNLLTAPKLASGMYYVPDMPAIFHAVQSPNYMMETQQVYNFGVDYTVKFRLTDDTSVKASIDGSSQNQPQGIVLTSIFLAGEEAHGAIMLMIFKEDAFPENVALGIPGLYENVILTLNYDGVNSGHVIAAAEVDSIHTVNASNEPQEPDFHTATLRIHDNADENHGPAISVYIDEIEVIKYSNTGTSHSVSPGVWDSDTSGNNLANSVLGIQSTAPYFAPYFENGVGVQAYNDSWQQAMWKTTSDGPATSLVTFGAMFQLGIKETDAGTNGSGEPGSSQYKSPEIASIDVKPYVTPAE